MSAQTRYSFSAPIGNPGGLVDLAPYAIDTFRNEEKAGVMKFGIGVVRGADAGKGIAVPASGATADQFEGITTNNRTTEYDMEGVLTVRKNAAVGVLRYGRIYARVAAEATPSYGDTLYLIVEGDEAGSFTNEDSGNVAVNGRFLSEVSDGVAVVELFNSPAPSAN